MPRKKPSELIADGMGGPVSRPADGQPANSKASGGGNRLMAMLVIGLACWLGYLVFTRVDWNGDGVRPGPSPEPVPAQCDLHVLIVEETSARDKLTASQVAIFSSIPLRKWYDANCVKEDGVTAYRNFDVDDKLDRENEIWRTLRSKVKLPPPSVLMYDGHSRTKEIALPADPDQLQSQLEDFKKGGK